MEGRRSVLALLLLLHILFLRGADCVVVTEVRLLSTTTGYVLQGQPATLVCRYLVDPPEEVTEVEWEREGSLVYLWTRGERPFEARGVLRGAVDEAQSSSGALALRKVTLEMRGTYTCRVRTNGKTAHNEMYLMVIVDSCGESSWKTHSDMIECTEDLNMHCIGIFPKPSPACGVYSEKTGKYLSSVPFDSVTVLHNGTYAVSFNRRFSVSDWLEHPDVTFRCYMFVLGTTWRSGITHKMFGDPGCEKAPPSIAHGYYNVSGELNCWGHPEEGASAEYHCQEEHHLTGTALYVCHQGQWFPEGESTSDATTACSKDSGTSLMVSSWLMATILLKLHLVLRSAPIL